MANLVPSYHRTAPAPEAGADEGLNPMADSGKVILAVEAQSSRKRWVFLGLAVLTQLCVAVIRIGIPALVPFIKRELNLSYTAVGLISSFLNGGAATAGIPAGKVVDRVGERMVLGYGTIASGVLVLGFYGVANYMGLLGYLFVIGFMTSTLVPAGGKAVIGWFNRNERGTAMGLRQMAVPLGGAVAAATLPPLAILYGWRFALTAAGIFSIVIGVIALRFYKEPAAAGPGRTGSQNPGIRTVLMRKGIRALLLYSVILSVAQWFYLTFLMLYLTENLHLSIVVGANLLATGQTFGAGGRVFWGLVSDRFFDGRRRPVLFLVGGFAFVMSILCSLLSAQTPLWVITLSVIFLGLTFQGSNGLTHTLATELAGSQMAGLAVGITNSCGFIGVMTLTPLFGLLIDWSGSYSIGWLGVASLILIAVLALAWIREEGL